MFQKRSFNIFLLYFLFLAICISGCIKEYSYEGGIVPPPVIDSSSTPVIPIPVADFPGCAFCSNDRDSYEENRWSFKVGNSFQCGAMDTAILTPDRNGFTFFGPSSCSPTTAMVITVYPENYTLNKDQHDLVISKVVFTYAKLGLPKFLLSTQRGTPFYLTIASYDYQTKMSIGTFSGDVYTADGTMLQVRGKFKIKLI